MLDLNNVPGKIWFQRWSISTEEPDLRTPCILSFLILLLLMQLALPGKTALAASDVLEDLHYRLAILLWPDAAHIRVTLKNHGQGRLVAEVLGETRGFIKTISGNQRERLQTEMVWKNGRLVPLIYREESWHHGKRAFKEYRFNYSKSRLTLWKWHKGKGLLKKWETSLQDQVYDPLTAFYNCRLQTLGPTREGETSTIPGIPYPQPEAMQVRLGPKTEEGQQAIVSLINPVYEGSRGEVFAMIDARRVPQKAWTTVFGLTIKGTLLPESVVMSQILPGLPGAKPAVATKSQKGDVTPEEVPSPPQNHVDFSDSSLKN